jgi:hypothetical protein
MRRLRPFHACCALALTGATIPCRAQEMEPRSYSPNPTGIQFLALAYGRRTGGVVTDASLPVTDIDAGLNSASVGYGRTFSLFGRSVLATVGVPYVGGDVSGNVGEARREITRSGLADARLRGSMNLIGGPALSPQEFARRKPQTTLGMSLTVVPPVGQYDPDKLINLGANRWSFKPELGVSYPHNRWYFEGYLGVWLFTVNDDFFGGSRREQDPITSLQTHIVYTLRPRLWLAFDANFYRGGRTTVDGARKADLQSNSRVGLTASVPVGAKQSLKLTWTDGATTRIGSDFTTLDVAWQYTWIP